MSAPSALVTGITGQDGSHLAELLLAKGYEVHGLVRNAAAPGRVAHLVDPGEPDPRLVLHEGDLTDSSRVVALLSDVAPDEVYHLGAPAAARGGFDQPELVGNAAGLGTLRLLEGLRLCQLEDTRFLHASSAEIFSAAPPPQDEHAVRAPRTPAGAAKLYAHVTTSAYREAHGMFAVNGILFDHASSRAGATSRVRGLAAAAVAVAAGRRRTVEIGSLDAVRDWGYAPEYVEGLWRMLQTDDPADRVLATGVGHAVADVARLCFAHVGLDWTDHVRPADSDPSTTTGALIGDASRAARDLGWRARTTLPELVHLLMEAELAAVRPGAGDVAPPMAG